MFASNIEYRQGYWYIIGQLHCDYIEVRRPSGISDIKLAEKSWEKYNDRSCTWEYFMLGGYAEDILREYVSKERAVS